MCHYRLLCVSIQVFNADFLRAILPIRTHGVIQFGQSCGQSDRNNPGLWPIELRVHTVKLAVTSQALPEPRRIDRPAGLRCAEERPTPPAIATRFRAAFFPSSQGGWRANLLIMFCPLNTIRSKPSRLRKPAR